MHTMLQADSTGIRGIHNDTGDIDSKAVAIAKRWQSDGSIKFGRKKDGGGIVSCDPLIFNQGDFVDVLVTFDIITMTKGAHKTVSIHLSPSQIVRLAKKDEMAKVRTNLFANGLSTNCHTQQFYKGSSSPKATPMTIATIAAEDKLVFDDEAVTAEDSTEM